MEYNTDGQSRRELRVLARIDRKRERQYRRVLADLRAREKYEAPDRAERDARSLDRLDMLATGVLGIAVAPLMGVMTGVCVAAEPVSEEPRKVRPMPVRVVNRW